MKKLLLTTMIFCLSATMIFAQNLITNGDFVTWTNTAAMPNNWDRGAGTVGTHYLHATDPVQGNILRLKDNVGNAGAKRFHTTANFSISTEGTYRVTFKVKGDVGLRFVALVKGTTAPSSSTQSATNHYTNITGYTSPTPVNDWTTVQTDIIVPSSATFGDDYRLHISWSHSTTTLYCDFYIDDISLVKQVAETSDKLSKIEITPVGYSPSAGTPDMTIPGFNQDVLEYTFTSSYKEVPVVSATGVDPTATVDIVQATSLTGTLAERTATITVTTTDAKEKTYTVEFIKHPGFISGISWDVRAQVNYIEWGEQLGIYTRNSNQSAGNIYAFGNTSARCNASSTDNNYHLTTPELANGASTLSFYLKNTNIEADETEVVVQKSTTASPDWVEAGRVQPNTSDYNNVWKEVNMNINDNSAGLKIRFRFLKTTEVSGTVYLDDVLIQAYSPLSNISDNQSTKPAVFGSNGRIIFTAGNETSYAVYHINGSKVAEGIASQGHSISLPRGIYIVKASEQTVKIVL